jgi:hypothetical protein
VNEYRQYQLRTGQSPRVEKTEFYVSFIEVMCSYHSMHPDAPTQDTEFYLDLLHVKRCWEMTQQTGKVINPDLETVEVEGHA